MLVDEFVNGEKRSPPVRLPCFEKVDEPLDGLLLLRGQGIDEIGKVLSRHTCLPPRSMPGLLVASVKQGWNLDPWDPTLDSGSPAWIRTSSPAFRKS